MFGGLLGLDDFNQGRQILYGLPFGFGAGLYEKNSEKYRNNQDKKYPQEVFPFFGFGFFTPT